MADNAIFSSFRRPVQSAPLPAQDALPRTVIASFEPDVIEPAPTPESVPSPPTHDGPRVERWADITARAIGCDQLGLANPACITLKAALRGSAPVRLDAEATGIYRPPGLGAAPWNPAAMAAGALG